MASNFYQAEAFATAFSRHDAATQTRGALMAEREQLLAELTAACEATRTQVQRARTELDAIRKEFHECQPRITAALSPVIQSAISQRMDPAR